MIEIIKNYKKLIQQFVYLKTIAHKKERDFFFGRQICESKNIINNYNYWKPQAELFISKWKYQQI